MRLSSADIRHLDTGALFLACAPDPSWCREQARRTLLHMEESREQPDLVGADALDDDALVVALGFVNNGLPLSELRPVGDEFVTSLRLVEEAIGRPASGVIPLAAANVNALVPMLTGMQLDVPVVDADPQGRVFPMLHQSVFTLAGLSAGPIGATGATGESALLGVRTPLRAERLVRALASEFGGWSATALYPMTARELRQHGILGSISRIIRLGEILDSSLSVAEKHDELRRVERVRRIVRARVSDVSTLSRPSPPGQLDKPSSVILTEEGRGRIVQLEIQNELLMVLLDGQVVATIPDIITLLHPEDASVANLEDLWVGNTLDIVMIRAYDPWYSEPGLALSGPDAVHSWR